MSLVENLINQISTQGLGGITKPQGFDLDDDTFAKLLEKQMNQVYNSTQSNLIGNLGAPAGFMIEPVNGIDFAEAVQDQMEILGENKYTFENDVNTPIEIKDIDMSDYFSSLIKTATDNNSDFLNFAKKQAAGAYGMFGKTFVEDMTDFVQDITAMS